MSWTLIIKSKDGAHAKFKASQDQVCGIINRVMGLLPGQDHINEDAVELLPCECVSCRCEELEQKLRNAKDTINGKLEHIDCLVAREISEKMRHDAIIKNLNKEVDEWRDKIKGIAHHVESLRKWNDDKYARGNMEADGELLEIIERIEWVLTYDTNSETEANS